MLRRIVDYAIESNEGHVRHAMSDGSRDYDRRPPEGFISDGAAMLKEGRETLERAKAMLDKGEKLMAKVENNWLLKLLRLV